MGTSEFSLLRPPRVERLAPRDRWGENAAADLALDEIAWALSISNKYHQAIQSILLDLCDDPQVITYRQEVLADLLVYPAVADGLAGLLPQIAKLRDAMESRLYDTPIRETLGRLGELRNYVFIVRSLQGILSAAGPGIRSRGLAALGETLAQVAADDTFQSLEKELPGLLDRLNGIPSITIGINLDSELQPVEAVLLGIHEKPFRGGGTLMDRLLGRRANPRPEQGIAPLHSVPYEASGSLDGRIVPTQNRADPLLVPLFRDLHEILKSLIAPITAALKSYARIEAGFLLDLEEAIAFYLGARDLVSRMQAAGLPTCCPQVLPASERTCRIKDIYNPVLALRLAEKDPDVPLKDAVVLNDVDFGPEGRIFILTGPNQGGKTVFVQAVGLAQVLFQAGLPVPAREAAISPVDGIHTHFATLERTDPGLGRLAEEAQRLSDIFGTVTDRSLVLLNESLSSTSPGESLYLSRDIVRALRLFGVRAIFATHLHELAEALEAVNAEVEGDSRVVSLVAGVALQGEDADLVDDIVPRTYEIKPGPPRGLSYARGIAARHGISYEQLAEQRQTRKGSE